MLIDRSELGGQIKIDFFSTEDLRSILDLIKKSELGGKPANLPAQAEMLEKHIASMSAQSSGKEENTPLDDRTGEETRLNDEVGQVQKADETDLYNISNFSI